MLCFCSHSNSNMLTHPARGRSLACMLFELATGDYLFHPHEGDKWCGTRKPAFPCGAFPCGAAVSEQERHCFRRTDSSSGPSERDGSARLAGKSLPRSGRVHRPTLSRRRCKDEDHLAQMLEALGRAPRSVDRQQHHSERWAFLF